MLHEKCADNFGMVHRMAVRINAQGVEIDGTTYPLYSGSVHYWRLDREKWPMLLDRVKEMGFGFVCTYIPWSVHEIGRGSFDFGEIDPQKNVGEFIDLCAERGLCVLVRPGPHINSELTYFGFPERLFDMDNLLAKTVDGATAFMPAPPRFFPIPSYASNDFYEEVGLFFDALCPILVERQYPNGPIVGVQADNEMSFFFRTSPFDLDYSDSSLELYRKYLSGKYKDIDTVRELYGKKYNDFDDIKPPRSFDARAAKELPWYFDWAEYKELYVFYGIHRTARMLRERGLDSAFYFHNYPSAYPVSPFHIPKMESQIDIAGLDLYRGRDDYESVKLASRFLAGTSRLPFVPEFGSGCWLWWKPLFLKDQELSTWTALMHGVKAFNFYMVVDRDRWYGAPVAEDGRKRDESFEFYVNFNKFLRKSRFNEYEMETDVLLLSVGEYERMEQMQSLLSPLPNLEPLGKMPQDWFVPGNVLEGLRDPIGALYKRQWRALWRGFSRAGFSVSVADSSVEQSVLDKYKVVAVPTFEFMNTPFQKRLLLYAMKGGTLLIGPRTPALNDQFQSETKFLSHVMRPVNYSDSVTVGGLDVERVDYFRAEHPLFQEEKGECCAYWRMLEKGKLAHLGFVFKDYHGMELPSEVCTLLKSVASLAGIEPRYPASAPSTETVVHRGPGGRLLFVSNSSRADVTTIISAGHADVLVDVETGEKISGPEAEVAIEGCSVRRFHIGSL